MDNVEIYDGNADSALLLGKFCEGNSPTVVITSSNQAMVRLAMKNGDSKFNLQWRATESTESFDKRIVPQVFNFRYVLLNDQCVRRPVYLHGRQHLLQEVAWKVCPRRDLHLQPGWEVAGLHPQA